MTFNKFPKIGFLSLFMICLLSCKRETGDLDDERMKLDSLRTELGIQKQRNDSLQELVEKHRSNGNIEVYFGREFDTISNPHELIANALKQQQDLIPMEGVLGGTMEFRQVQVLSEKWILAVYDDGHIQGKSIFEYKLNPGGKVEFKEVISERP